jgi:hypothetical protein
MIITENKKDIEILGVDDTLKMRLSKSDEVEAHIVKILTENYRFPIASHVREAVSNHLDSHVENGNPNEPILVSLYKNETGNYTFETRDNGLGLSAEEFDKYYMQVGESSKRGKADLIGGKGCGAKAILSYRDSYEVICRKDGIENKFLVFKGEVFPERTLIYTKETFEPNGVIVKINVDKYDFRDFKDAIKEQLCYFPTCYIQIEGDTFDYLNAKIYENELFKWSEIYPDNEMHIAFGVCRYPIDWKVMDMNPINIPIAIKIPIDSGVDVQFNRESLTYNKFTKEYIKEKIKLIANWFVEKYNEEVKEYDTILDAWKEFNKHSKYVELRDKTFCIDSIIKYATEVPKEFSVKNLPDARYFYNKVSSILNNYHYVGYSDYYGNLYKKNIGVWKADFLIDNTSSTVIVNEVPSRNVKSFLLEKYEGKKIHYLVPPKENKRRFKPEKGKLHDEFCYWDILNLNNVTKSSWGTYIRQFNSVEEQFKSKLIDETQVETSKEFLQWKENKKQERKSKPRNVDSNYVVLDKKEDEYTLAVCRNSSFYGKCVFDKQTEKVHASSKNKFLTVYFDETDREKAEFYFKIVKNIRIAIIGKRERLKIQNNHNFMTPEQFEKSKPFKRLVTAIKFDSLLDKYRNMKHNSNDIIKKCLPKLNTDLEILEEYVRENFKDTRSTTQTIMDLAESQNLWDYEHMDAYNRIEKELEQYSFLQYLQVPSYWDDKARKEINSIITKMLYVQKTVRGLHDNIEITIKEPQLEEVA